VQFGAYKQEHKPHNNLLMPRTAGAIALGEMVAAQGIHYILIQHSGERTL